MLKAFDPGKSIDEIIREHGISRATFYKWRQRYGGMEASELKRVKELERENDLAFDELFENDLREWIRKASDEEKDFVRNMNLNKYCSLPTFSGLEKLLVFNIGQGEFAFIRTDGTRVEKEPNSLKALRQIRTFDNLRQQEKIGLEEKSNLLIIGRKIFDAERAFQTTIEGMDLSEFTGVKSNSGGTPLAAAKQKLLDLLHENAERYSLDNIKRLQSLLTSKNLAVDNKIRAYLKRYDNDVSMDFLDSMAILSINLIKA